MSSSHPPFFLLRVLMLWFHFVFNIYMALVMCLSNVLLIYHHYKYFCECEQSHRHL